MLDRTWGIVRGGLDYEVWVMTGPVTRYGIVSVRHDLGVTHSAASRLDFGIQYERTM